MKAVLNNLDEAIEALRHTPLAYLALAELEAVRKTLMVAWIAQLHADFHADFHADKGRIDVV